MRNTYLLIISLFVISKPYAQDSSKTNCLKTVFCSISLCDVCNDPFTIQRDNSISYEKTTTSTYPGDKQYLNEDGDGSCVPGSNGCNKNGNVLFYDVYYPDNYAYYRSCPLPAVVFVHGGGFSECAPFSSNLDECEYFAHRGFVVFNISYRIGTRLTPSASYQFFSVQQQLAVYRASQDVRGAIRSIIQRQIDQDSYSNSDPRKTAYQINPDWIFLAGASAGAITVLNVAYYNQTMLDAINLYDLSVSPPVPISTALGPIDADYYYGGTNIEYASKIKGVCDQWGSVTVPGQYYLDSTHAKDFFTRRIPVIAFHGQQDPVVPFYNRPVNYAEYDNTFGFFDTYVKESTCLLNGVTFRTDNGSHPNPDFATFGSFSFYHQILQPLNIPSELYIDCQALHGLRNAGPTYLADYGTGYTTQTQTTEFIVGRAAVFFQNIITGNAQTRQNFTPELDKIFVECRNNYLKCNTTDNTNPGCDNGDVCR